MALDATPAEIEQAVEGWMACQRALAPKLDGAKPDEEVVEIANGAEFHAWVQRSMKA